MSKIKIGHDLVSFKENALIPGPRHGKKILSPKEYAFWENLEFCPMFYWQCWSLKESLYKLHMKLQGKKSLIFTQLETGLIPYFRKTLGCSYTHQLREQTVYLKVEVKSEYLQTFATTSPFFGKVRVFINNNCEPLTQKSEVRNLVKKHLPDYDLTFQKWLNRASFPVLTIKGKKLSHMDISLSHDGKFASACLFASIAQDAQ